MQLKDKCSISRKATLQQTKIANKRLVLRTVYEHKMISRAGIARQTKLTKPTVSLLASELLEEALIEEFGQAPSSGGKPATLLRIDPNIWNLISLYLERGYCQVNLTNISGEIIETQEVVDAKIYQEAALETVYTLIDQAMGLSAPKVLGIGVGVPGLTDPIQGKILSSIIVDWHGIPLKNMLQDRYGLPVHVANDAQAAALAEYTYGPEQESKNLILIRMETGIGSGIVLDGQLYYGDSSGAGEIGQMLFDTKYGTLRLEEIATIQSMLSQTKRADQTWKHFVEAVHLDNHEYITIVENAAQIIGTAISHLILAFDIHNIVISGRISKLGEVFLEQIRQTIASRTLSALSENTNLRYASISSDIVLRGCEALILKEELGVIE